jgi:hypothetical protein
VDGHRQVYTLAFVEGCAWDRCSGGREAELWVEPESPTGASRAAPPCAKPQRQGRGQLQPAPALAGGGGSHSAARADGGRSPVGGANQGADSAASRSRGCQSRTTDTVGGVVNAHAVAWLHAQSLVVISPYSAGQVTPDGVQVGREGLREDGRTHAATLAAGKERARVAGMQQPARAGRAGWASRQEKPALPALAHPSKTNPPRPGRAHRRSPPRWTLRCCGVSGGSPAAMGEHGDRCARLSLCIRCHVAFRLSEWEKKPRLAACEAGESAVVCRA